MTVSLLDPLITMMRRAVGAALTTARDAAHKTGRPFFIVDATAGNGHDTLFLAEEAGTLGQVFAFDVQQGAIEKAKQRLHEAGADLAARVTFVHAGHETIKIHLPPEAAGNLAAATFNLGYLPGSDKRVVTEERTTITALETLVSYAASGCVISVHAYRGHEGGEKECEAVAVYLAALPWEEWRVAEYSFINKRKNRETLFLLERM
ncbi:MAG: hypothetical protein DELT_00048 [Desulfovibrio sp.]